MARVGLPYSVFAPITTETPGAAMVYGTPSIFNHPIEANVSYEISDNPLHGGDVIAENDNSITGGSLSFNHTHLTPEDKAALLGHVKSGNAPDDYYEEGASPSPTGGFGYITAEIEKNVRKWYGYWIHKTQLGMSEDNATTKGDAIDWQTPTLNGPIMGVSLDNTGLISFRRYKVFTTMAEAKTWINNLAGVNEFTAATPVADPAAGEVTSGDTVALTAGVDAVIYYTTDGSTPTTGSMIYTAPIAIYGPMTIKAIAVKTGMSNSAVLTASYTIAA